VVWSHTVLHEVGGADKPFSATLGAVVAFGDYQRCTAIGLSQCAVPGSGRARTVRVRGIPTGLRDLDLARRSDSRAV